MCVCCVFRELAPHSLSSSFGKLLCPQWIWTVGRGKLRVLRGGWCPHCLWISTCSVEANIWAAPPGSRPWYLGAPLLDIWAPSSWRASLPLGNTLATLLFASSSYAILMFHSVFRAFDHFQWKLDWFWLNIREMVECFVVDFVSKGTLREGQVLSESKQQL